MSKLYKFQQESIDRFMNHDCACVLLGDDMGLGKTVQAIVLDKERRAKYTAAFHERYKGKAMTLVVAPLSTLGAWKEHFDEWQPSLRVTVINPKYRERFVQDALHGKYDVFICHWESLRLMPELASKIMWFNIISDEVHRAKNRDAQQTKALKALHTEYKMGCSGTAADNQPQDFWSVANWLWPSVFSSYWRYYNRHVISKHHTVGICQADGCFAQHKNSFKEILGVANVEEIHQAMGWSYLRRLKEDVLKELPDKYYTNVFVDLHPQQRRAYEAMREDMLAWVGQHEEEPLAAPVVIAQLTRLQQFAVAFGELQTNTKRHWVEEQVEILDEETGEGTGEFKDVKTLREFEETRLKLTDPSAKLDAVMDIIQDNPSQQIVVFAQSRQVIQMLAARLEAKKIPTGVLIGGLTPEERTRIVADFQAHRTRVFAGTIKAGGEGITLTASSTVIFIDRAWSPSANRQAEDRCHRIGQPSAVQIINIIANNTIDRERLEKIDLKWSWLRELLGDTKK